MGDPTPAEEPENGTSASGRIERSEHGEVHYDSLGRVTRQIRWGDPEEHVEISYRHDATGIGETGRGAAD